MILVLVRHGQTDYNHNRLVQGRMDNPLNMTGKNQAFQLGVMIKDQGETFDLLGSSPLTRAKQTATIIGNLINKEINFTDSHFLERDFGPFEGKSIDDVLPLITKDDFFTEGYEDNQKLIKRISSATKRLYKKYHDKKVLLVVHAHVIKSLLILVDKDKYNYTNHFVGNSSMLYFNVEKDQITLIKQIDL